MSDQIDEVVAEAKTGFSLKDRLQGRALRTATVTVYTDEVLGEKHQDAEREIANLKALLRPIEGVTLGDDVVAETTKQINAAEKKLKALTKDLRASGLTFNLRAVPEIVGKASSREARKTLGIKGGVPAEKLEAFADLFNAIMLTHVVTDYVDHASGETIPSLSVEDAQALEDFLPANEYARLKAAYDDLQTKNVISESITAQADF